MAISEGKSLSQFRDDFNSIVARYGWSYNGNRNWRSRLIYQTNVRSAYAAGQWQQFQETKEAMPYLRYLTAGDERVRDSHQPYNNAAYHIDDPFWQTNYPPNGYNCRCTVIALSSI